MDEDKGNPNDTWPELSEETRLNPLTGCLVFLFTIVMDIWNRIFPLHRD